MNNKCMEFIKSVGTIDYYLFNPSFGKWYFTNYPEYERITIPHFIRMAIEYIEGGYRIYYLLKDNDVLGYILVTNGGGRLKCSTASDIVLGPIWISTKLRGHGIGTEGIRVVLHELNLEYRNAYEYIKCSNIASIRSVEKNGFVNIGKAKNVSLLKRIILDNDGDMFVYKYESLNKENSHMDYKGKNVLVMDGGSRQCLPILKGLHELKCNITTINCSKLDNGFSSRYPTSRLLKQPETDLVAYLRSVVNTKKYDVLIPLSDESMDKITPYINELRKYVKIPVPDREVFLRAYDKQTTMLFCADNSIPCPRTLLEKFDIDWINENIGFPLIAKPRMACGSKGLKIVKNANELLKLIELKEIVIEEYVIQEFIPQNGRQYNVHLFMDDSQNLCSGVVTEKTRWYPVDGGASCLCRTIVDEKVLSDCERLLKAIKWRGYCEIELIEDTRDGLFKVMEINGRASASIKIMDLAGINVAQQMMELAFDAPVTRMAVEQNDVRMRRLSTDLLWFIQSKDRFTRKPSWFSLERTHEVVFSLKDPKPFFATGLSLLAKLTSYKKEMQMRRR